MIFPHFILYCRQDALNNRIVRQSWSSVIYFGEINKPGFPPIPPWQKALLTFVGFWDVFPECSEVLVYLQMLGRLPRLLNYSLAYFTLGLRGRRSNGEGVGNLGSRQHLREKPLALLVRPKSPFPSRRTPVTQATFHLRPFSTDAFLATHVNER